MYKMVNISLQAIMILLISFVAGEISLRIYNYFNPNFIFYNDTSYNRFRGRPFADDWGFKLNSIGFKDKEFTPKKEDTYRIIGIGDSFSFGVVPYKYNYLTLTESQLYQKKFNVDVLNMGIPGIGPGDYLDMLVNEGLSLQPDMVLISFFVGNDFFDRIPKSRELYSYSYIASLFHYILTIKPKYQETNGGNVYCDTCPSFDHKSYLEIERNRSYIYHLESELFINDLNEALLYLKKIQQICERNNIKLVIVIIPDELQVNTELQTELINTYFPSLPSEFWQASYPNNMLSKSLTDLNIEYIDLYDAFVQEEKNQRLYRPRDTHWNIAGNQLAADIIVENLQEYIPKYPTEKLSQD